mgnify:CR=1 FL=1
MSKLDCAALALSYLLGRKDVDLLGISTVTVSAVERAKLAAGCLFWAELSPV